MQVVYSGGSSTPSPSPRLQRKANPGGYGRPVMPGYLMAHPHQIIVQRSREKLTEGDTSLRDSIPAMSKPMAIVCLVLNVLLPGFGTFVSGLTVLCGAHVRSKGATKRGVVWVNSGVALLQFLLTFLFLLGWIWSIMWGTAFLTISDEYYKKSRVEEVSVERPPKSSSTPKRNASPQTNYATSQSVSSSRSNALSPTDAMSRNQNGVSANFMGGVTSPSPAASTYLNPSTSNGRNRPIIVLQEAPVIVNHSETTPSQTIMHARTRHEKILRRQMSDHELSPFILTHQMLEAIVIHDVPISRQTRPQLAALEDVESEHEVTVPRKT